jgi:hypothetical protein
MPFETRPTLVEILEHAAGAELVLSDGTRLVVDVSPAALAQALAADGQPQKPGGAAVYFHPIEFTESQWLQISHAVRNAPAFEPLAAEFPGLARQLETSFADLICMPLRVYGGSSVHQIYLMHPLGFRPSPPPSGDRNERGWYYALLSQPGGWVFKTWTNVQTAKTHIEHGRVPEHFLVGLVSLP